MTDDARTPPPARSGARTAVRALLWTVLGLFVLCIALVGGVAWFASSGSGLPYAIDQVRRLTGGKLEIEGAHGSLLSKLEIRQLRWHGATTTIVAHDIVVEWRPAALARRELRVDTLGARAVEIDIAPSADTPAVLPRSLGLPLDVAIGHASVGTLDWKLGERAGRVTGIAFGYAGGAREHRVDGVTLAFARGRVDGNASIDAAAPFAVKGMVTLAGSGDLASVGARATLAGTLARIGVTASGQANAARFDARAQLTPFASTVLDTLDIDATDVDASAFDAAWPHSAFALEARARPISDGFAGTLALANAAPGRIDDARIPLQSLSASFAQDDKAIALRDIDARVPGGGRISGKVDIALDTRAASATLALAGVDLNALHGALTHSSLSGSVRATGNAKSQTVDADLADRARALSLAFAARIADAQVTLSHARLVAAAGTLDGHGEIALSATRAFAFELTAAHFDPSRIGAFPAGALQGNVKLRGRLAPDWTLVADATLAPGARLGVQPVSGSAHAALSARMARDVALDVRIGQAHVSAQGNAGRPGDTLAFAVDAARLADLAPLLPQGALEARSGALHAHGTLAIEPAGIGGHVEAQASNLLFAAGRSIASLSLKADVAAPVDARHPLALAQRTLSLDAQATGLADATHRLSSASVNAQGTLAAHRLRIALASNTDHLALSAHGALDVEAKSPFAWHGTLDALDLGGTLAISLRAPVAVDFASQHVHVGAASLSVADGSVTLGDTSVDDGRIASRGAFDGVPLATVARLAGQPLPMASTLTLQGEWSLAATPRLDGTLSVRNAQGDVFASDPLSPSAADYALGIGKLVVDARVHADAWTIDASVASLRAGSASLQATLAAGAAPGVPSLDASLSARLIASLPSLAPLQPWIGTSAVVGGRANVDVRASGTLRAPVLSGTASGDALRIDAPQWGVSLTDGRLRASLANNVVTLDEFTFAGGDGRFTATGTLAHAGASGAGAHVAWHAQHFRLLNRPDLNLVITGEGAVTTAPRKLALSGKLSVDKGAIVYAPRTALLGDDVIVKGGRKREVAQANARVPALALDLDVDLGSAMTFSGEGLEATLGGRVHVTTASDGTLDGQGTIRALRGTYYAFGQQLTIDRGRLIFNGPLDNPALDIVALRKNLAVEAGVSLTGTVRVPHIQLTSNPPVSDGEKLSWLITGQAPGTGSSADAAALAAASSYLLGGNGRPIGARIAQQLGLDDISVRAADSGPSSSATPASGQVVSIGKRLSNRLTLVYEQGLTVATNALRLEYALTRTLTLRVEAGTVSGIGIFFRRSYD